MKKDKFNIRFVGLAKVKVVEKEIKRLVEIAEREANKIYRELKNNFDLIINIKEYEKTGKENKRRKYTIHLKLQVPGQTFTSGGGIKETWDAKAALHKAFENIKNKIRTAYKSDSSWKKDYE